MTLIVLIGRFAKFSGSKLILVQLKLAAALLGGLIVAHSWALISVKNTKKMGKRRYVLVKANNLVQFGTIWYR